MAFKIINTKWLFIFFAVIVFSACTSTIKAETPRYALGTVEGKQILEQFPKFAKAFDNFVISKEQQEQVKKWPNKLHIDVYFGTWCHDSQREIPRFLKVMQLNTDINVNLVALDYDKSDPKGLAEQQGVKYTPTMIIYYDNKELGRVIERPKVSLIDDISALLNVIE